MWTGREIGVKVMEGIRTAHSVDCRVVRIGDDECKLCACVPTFRRSFWVCIVEVDRDGVVGWRVGIPEWKQQYAPLKQQSDDLERCACNEKGVWRTIYVLHTQTPDS